MADAPAPTDGGRSGRGRTRAAPGIDPRTAALVEHLSETVFLVGDDGEAGLRLGPSVGPLGFGVDEEDGGPVHVAERVHPDDLLTVLGLIDEVRRTPGLRTTVHVRARHKDGSWRRIEAVIASVVDDPDVRGALMRIRDVTGSDDAAARGPRAGEGGEPGDVGARFRSLAEAVPSGILCADGRGSVVFSNEAAHRILECPAARLLGRGWSEAVLAEDRDEVVAAARSVLGDEGSAEATFRVAGAAGTRWVHARFVPLAGAPPATAGGNGTRRSRAGWLVALDDVTDRRRLESQLAHRATHDPLTELPNRALLEDRLAQAAARLGRTGEEVAVLFCDLDDFKEVNDRFGHVVGDEVLVEVGRRIGSVLRPADTVARYGGDEFVVVCEGTGAEAAAEVAQRITAALAEPFAGAGGGRLKAGLRVSVGVAASDDPAVDPGDLLLRADQDMYRVKQAGDGASS